MGEATSVVAERIVPRTSCESAEAFDRIVARRDPVVLTGALEDWPARREWQPSYLVERAGTARITLRNYARNADVEHDRWTTLAEGETTTLGEFIARMESRRAQHRYLAGVSLRSVSPALASDVRKPSFVNMRTATPLIWLGPGGHVEPLHFDSDHGLLAQIMGSKRIVLYAPRDYGNLYPFEPWQPVPPWFSRVDIDRPDPKKFPRFARARPAFDDVLCPGEMLFIPTGWWHQVYCLDPICASVTHFCEPTSGERIKVFRREEWYANSIVRAVGYERIQRVRHRLPGLL